MGGNQAKGVSVGLGSIGNKAMALSGAQLELGVGEIGSHVDGKASAS